MHVLVTGGAGYLGSVLSEHLLAQGHEVTVLDNLLYEEHSLYHLCASPRFNFVYGDARDRATVEPLLKNADAIVPLACIVGAPACDRDLQLAETTNYEAVKLLLELRSTNQAMVYPTTNSGYGTTSGEVHCTEETPLEPITAYGRTKVDAEKAVLDADNTVTLRLATVFGTSPRMRLDLLVNHFTYVAVTDGYIVIFEKDFKRNFVHIRDVADCFLYCLGNMASMAGRPYNLGLDAANLSKEELVLKIKEHVPGFYVHFAEIGSDPDKRNYIVSNERIRQAGFEPSRTLDDGIPELINAYRMLGRRRWHNV